MTATAGRDGASTSVDTWISGSLAVVVPVEVERPPEEAGEPGRAPRQVRRPGVLVDAAAVTTKDPVWDLKQLRRASRTDPLVSPRDARVPIRDRRIMQTQPPMHYRLHGIGTEVPASATDPARTDWWTVKAVEVFAFDTPLDVFDTPLDLTTSRTHHVDTPAERERRRAAGEPLHGRDRDAAPQEQAPSDRFMAYVVLHVVLKPRALASVRETVAYFSLPSSGVGQQQYWPVPQLRSLFGDLGLDGTVRWRRRPFVLTHLVPAAGVPRGADLLRGAREHGWTDEQIWAWRLASGPDLDHDAEPGWDPHTPAHGGFWSGSTWCRTGHLGASFIGTRPLDQLPTAGAVEGRVTRSAAGSTQYVEHARVEAFVHRNAVDLTILAMRQTRFLQQHALALKRALAGGAAPGHGLPGTARQAGAASADVAAWELAHDASAADLATAVRLERRLIEFRNELWLDHAPGEPDVTSMIAGLHQALGPDRLLSEIDAEQQGMTRVLGLTQQQAAAALARAQHQAAELQAAAAAEQTRAQQEAREDARTAAAEQERRRKQLDKVVTFVAPLVAVPGVVLGFAQVYLGDSGRSGTLWAAVLIVVLCLASWEVLTHVLLGRHLPSLVRDHVVRSRRGAGGAGGAGGAATAPEDPR